MSRKSYELLKLESVDTNKCIRVGCNAAPADDSLLCPDPENQEWARWSASLQSVAERRCLCAWGPSKESAMKTLIDEALSDEFMMRLASQQGCKP